MKKHTCPRCDLETPRVIKYYSEYICQLCYVRIPVEERTKAALEERLVI
ncbi:hypothetical protein NC661_18270 [Aquibacillus koreensis]|uniref:Uncharacterized protein n=1 Tax=Aquibacillus koreensis TaxID=279446 RepID=A0A9X3WMA5_9BACI|nr:hypothetical protein [Aquibacillus koreensis]MCT2535465.1 hypothetical protein [Aquibacillus koreensis]MDC3422300.1 hypothetical protein [Aquibacillus koreensis]